MSLDDLVKCPNCDGMVDRALLGDVFWHLVEGGCVTGAPRNEEMDKITGVKETPDA